MNKPIPIYLPLSLAAAAAGVLLLLASHADAQQTAKVLSTCGTAGYTAGTVNASTMDTTGAACGSSGGGGTGGTSSTFGAAFPATGTAQGLQNGSNMVSSATVPGAANGVQQVGGSVTMVVDNPTITAGAYSVGQCVGGFRQITVAQFAGQSSSLSSLRALSASGSTTAAFTVIYFLSQPSASTCTDNGTFAIAAADYDKIFGPLQQIQPTSPPAPSGVTTPTIAQNAYTFAGNGAFVPGGSAASGSTTIWYALVNRTAAWTPPATTDLHLLFTVTH